MPDQDTNVRTSAPGNRISDALLQISEVMRWPGRAVSQVVQTANGINPNALQVELVTAAEPKLILRRRGIEFEQDSTDNCNNIQRSEFTYLAKDGKQHYYRTSDGEDTSKIVKGYRSRLTIEQSDGTTVQFVCIERANGFVHVRPGTYTVTLTPRATFPNKQEIHVTDNVFIHVSNSPCQLDGCIAPGTEDWEGYGVRNSAAALSQIIEALGGWDQGKQFEMEIRGEKTSAGTEN